MSVIDGRTGFEIRCDVCGGEASTALFGAPDSGLKDIVRCNEHGNALSASTQLTAATERIATLEAEVTRVSDAIVRQSRQIDQTLGQALGFPWYKDDQKNFPGATEADGVCTGEHVPETLAVEAASRIRALEEENARLRQCLGDDLSTCSAPGCGAWYVSDGSSEPSTGWVQAVGEFPAKEYCAAHAGMAVSG